MTGGPLIAKEAEGRLVVVGILREGYKGEQSLDLSFGSFKKNSLLKNFVVEVLPANWYVDFYKDKNL